MLRCLFMIFVWVGILLSLSHFMPTVFWWQEALRNLWTYTITANLLGFTILLVWKPKRDGWLMACLLLFLVAGYGVELYPYRPGFPEKSSEVQPARRVNVLFIPDDRAMAVSAEQADILIRLTALDPFETPEYRSSGYPYFLATVQKSALNFVLSSRYLISDQKTLSIGEDMPPVLLTSVDLGEQETLHIAAMQLFSPLNKEAIFMNSVIIRRMGMKLRFLDGPLIAAAVMHSTQFTRTHGVFEYVSRTKNASRGQGLLLDFERVFGIPYFPGSHFFVKRGVEVERLESSGSGLLLQAFVH